MYVLVSSALCTTGQEINMQDPTNFVCADCPMDEYQDVNLPTTTNRCTSCLTGSGTLQTGSESSDCMRKKL